ncbi:MAG TPA: stage II sporulation protein M, partial [Phototrophicaceae bacterium]|nr:stage II sporulation protein M [Phototrophicaceae bacterium]
TIDQLNLRKFVAKIWRYFRAVDAEGTPARNLVEWYRKGVGLSLSRARIAILLTIGVFVVFFIGGILIGQLPQWRLPLPPNMYSTNVTLSSLDGFLRPQIQSAGFRLILMQNARILIGALLLSMFTFGVAALILTPAVYVILGYLISQIALSGNNINIILASVVPHGIVEIPVIILAAAISLKLGAVITRPPEGMTVGQAWQMTLGDTLKILVGLVIPGLVVAAMLEAFVTPHIVVAVLGG